MQSVSSSFKGDTMGVLRCQLLIASKQSLPLLSSILEMMMIVMKMWWRLWWWWCWHVDMPNPPSQPMPAFCNVRDFDKYFGIYNNAMMVVILMAIIVTSPFWRNSKWSMFRQNIFVHIDKKNNLFVTIAWKQIRKECGKVVKAKNEKNDWFPSDYRASFKGHIMKCHLT